MDLKIKFDKDVSHQMDSLNFPLWFGTIRTFISYRTTNAISYFQLMVCSLKLELGCTKKECVKMGKIQHV